MTKTSRKRAKKSRDAETIDMDSNVNSNHSAEHQTNELSNNSEHLHAKVVKLRKLNAAENLEQISQSATVFNEDEHVVEMEVDSQDTISEGEVVSNPSEEDNEATETEPSDTDPSNLESDSDADHDQTDASLNQSCSSAHSTPKKKAKK